MHEVRARLAELREIRDHRLVRSDQVAIAASLPAEAESGLALLLRRKGDREVRADSGERIECLLLRPVETVRQAGDRDHQRDAEPQAEQRDNGARSPAYELVPQVAEVEHSAEQTSTG